MQGGIRYYPSIKRLSRKKQTIKKIMKAVGRIALAVGISVEFYLIAVMISSLAR